MGWVLLLQTLVQVYCVRGAWWDVLLHFWAVGFQLLWQEALPAHQLVLSTGAATGGHRGGGCCA